VNVGLSRRTGWARAASYGAGLLIGLAAVVYMMPLPAIVGTGPLWVAPFNVDLAQNLTGHLIFQRPGWHWPLLSSPDLFWPRGASIAMTDSNPLVSLIAKILATLRGEPANLLGLWFAACWLLQPVAAVYAVRGFEARRWEAALAAAIVAACFPAFLIRVGHINLCGHFLLLLALGRSARMLRSGAGRETHEWISAYLILLTAVLVHPFLFLMASAILAAPPLQSVGEGGGRWRRLAINFVATVVLAFLPFLLLSGTTGGMDRGYGFYSMNLLSPVWPQHSGIFGRDLPAIDATGGQYEGFNYLGAGGLLSIAVAGFVAWKYRPFAWRPWWGLIAILVLLTILALSNNIYAGNLPLLRLGGRQWDSILGFIRSSGRLFWPVGYALLLGSIAVLSNRLPRPYAAAALVAVMVLQIVDSGPLRGNARDYMAGGGPPVAHLYIPDGVRLLTTLPVCTQTDDGQTIAALARLQAVRTGARLSDIKLSRPPSWFNCERSLTDGMELPLRPGEVRLLMEPVAIQGLRKGVFGNATSCRRYGGPVVCARDVTLIGGDPVEINQTLPQLAQGTVLNGPAIQPILSFGWRADVAGGDFLSEGPRTTLLASMPEIMPAILVLRLTLIGIARTAGGERPVTIQVGEGQPIDVTLIDQAPTKIDIPIVAATLPNGILRVAFDIFRPVDPTRRGLVLPVNRAGIRIEKIELSAPAG
jgi:hypothetical protein